MYTLKITYCIFFFEQTLLYFLKKIIYCIYILFFDKIFMIVPQKNIYGCVYILKKYLCLCPYPSKKLLLYYHKV